MILMLHIPGDPIPFRAPFVGKRRCFNPRHKELTEARKIIATQYRGEPINQAISCEMIFFMPIPKGTSKKKKALMLLGAIRPTKRPDRDNLSKFYSDVIQGIVLFDDSLIVDGRVAKYYSESPSTTIKIEVL